MKKEIPFVSFSNSELENKPGAYEGMPISCPTCRKQHNLTCGTNTKTGEKSDLLLFYKCGKKDFLGAINGKLIIGG